MHLLIFIPEIVSERNESEYLLDRQLSLGHTYFPLSNCSLDRYFRDVSEQRVYWKGQYWLLGVAFYPLWNGCNAAYVPGYVSV